MTLKHAVTVPSSVWLTRAGSLRTRRCLWWSSCPSGSGWEVNSLDRVCISAGCGPLWSDWLCRAHIGHPLHSQSHIPAGIKGRYLTGEEQKGEPGERKAPMWTNKRPRWNNDPSVCVWDPPAEQRPSFFWGSLSYTGNNLSDSHGINGQPSALGPRRTPHLNEKGPRGRPLLVYWEFIAEVLSGLSLPKVWARVIGIERFLVCVTLFETSSK